jgi:DNA-binding HxlR family transcriptional regulator
MPVPGSKTKIWTSMIAGANTGAVKTYGQYCPIARGAEVFAERWTPVIMRNVLMGCETFTEIQRGAPSIPRSLLATRLSLLERQQIIARIPLREGRGWRYVPTDAGRDLWGVCVALGEWAARWLELGPEHLDPGMVLWSMCRSLVPDRLPDRRVVVGFEFVGTAARHSRLWLLVEHGSGEVCAKAPGEEDLHVVADADCFVRWHLGRISWTQALSGGDIRVDGPRSLARAFPGWSARSTFAHVAPARR